MRNLLALIGLITLLAIAVIFVRLGPTLARFDDRFLTVHAEFAGKLLETGDPGVSMVWSVPVDAGLTAEEVIESMICLTLSRMDVTNHDRTL